MRRVFVRSICLMATIIFLGGFSFPPQGETNISKTNQSENTAMEILKNGLQGMRHEHKWLYLESFPSAYDEAKTPGENIKDLTAALEKKKGEDVKIIDISEVSDFADFFVIATGNNSNQLDAMEDEVGQSLNRINARLKNTEGNKDSNWILMDYGDVIVHLFDKESRSFYDLDHIWKDGKVI